MPSPLTPALSFTLAVSLCAAMMAPARGQAAKLDLAAKRTAVAQAISDCRKVADKDARLDCYDKAADAFEQAQVKGQVVVVDREQVREVKQQAFGFNLPSLNLFARGPKEEAVDKISVKLASAVKTPRESGSWSPRTARSGCRPTTARCSTRPAPARP